MSTIDEPEPAEVTPPWTWFTETVQQASIQDAYLTLGVVTIGSKDFKLELKAGAGVVDLQFSPVPVLTSGPLAYVMARRVFPYPLYRRGVWASPHSAREPYHEGLERYILGQLGKPEDRDPLRDILLMADFQEGLDAWAGQEEVRQALRSWFQYANPRAVAARKNSPQHS